MLKKTLQAQEGDKTYTNAFISDASTSMPQLKNTATNSFSNYQSPTKKSPNKINLQSQTKKRFHKITNSDPQNLTDVGFQKRGMRSYGGSFARNKNISGENSQMLENDQTKNSDGFALQNNQSVRKGGYRSTAGYFFNNKPSKHIQVNGLDASTTNFQQSNTAGNYGFNENFNGNIKSSDVRQKMTEKMNKANLAISKGNTDVNKRLLAKRQYKNNVVKNYQNNDIENSTGQNINIEEMHNRSSKGINLTATGAVDDENNGNPYLGVQEISTHTINRSTRTINNFNSSKRIVGRNNFLNHNESQANSVVDFRKKSIIEKQNINLMKVQQANKKKLEQKFKNIVLQNHMNLFKSSFKKRNFIKCMNFQSELVLLAVEINSQKLFYKVLFFLCDLFNCFGNTDAAFALLMQISYSIDYTEEKKMHSICYTKMADICINQKNYNAADKLQHKALETAWLFDDKDSESYIYDKLGIVKYLLGEIAQAAYYHDKGIDLVIDKNEQLSKDNCIEALKINYKKNPLAGPDLTLEILHYFSFTDEYFESMCQLAGLEDKAAKLGEMAESQILEEQIKCEIHKKTCDQKAKLLKPGKSIEQITFHNSNLHQSQIPFITFMKADAVRKTIKEYLSSKKLQAIITTNFNANKVPKIIQSTIDYLKKYKNSSNKLGQQDNAGSKKKPIFTDKKNKLDWYDQQLANGVSTKEFVDSIMMRARMSLSTVGNHIPSLISHLSCNRTVTQFSPYFDASLPIDSFYNEIQSLTLGNNKKNTCSL